MKKHIYKVELFCGKSLALRTINADDEKEMVKIFTDRYGVESTMLRTWKLR